MMSKEYQSVSLPKGLAKEIQEYIAGRGCGQGYVSVSDFVKDACRRRLEEVG